MATLRLAEDGGADLGAHGANEWWITSGPLPSPPGVDFATTCARIGCRKPQRWECGGCKRERYCSETCQRMTWEMHGSCCITSDASDVTWSLSGMSIGNGNLVESAEELMSRLEEAYTYEPTGLHFPAFFGGRAIEFLRMQSIQQIDDVMARRKEVIGAVSLVHSEELTSYDDHPIRHQDIRKWVQLLEEFPDKLEDYRERTDYADLEINFTKTWPGFDADDYDAEDVIEKITSDAAVRVARAFGAVLGYVGKDEFLAMARRTVAIAIENARVEGASVVWVSYTASNRSPAWMTLVLWDEFRNDIDAVVASYSELHALAASPVLSEKYRKIVAIVPDDASYSGMQLAIELGTYARRLGDFDATSNIEIAFGVPFVSELAMANLAQAQARSRRVTASVRTEGSRHMKTLYQQFAQIEGASDALRSLPANAFVQLTRGTHIPVYFAHKLADHVSVPNHLIAVAPYPKINGRTGKIDIRTRSFIGGCVNKVDYEYAPIDNSVNPPLVANDFVQEAGKMCPLPVYKRVQLTYEGRVIEATENLVLFSDIV